MAKGNKLPQTRPALTPEAREKQIIAMAMDLAEEQIRDKSASSQTINHFLKLGSIREKLEMEKLSEENRLLRAKTEALESAKRVEELYADAIKAMRKYGGQGDEYDDDQDI